MPLIPWEPFRALRRRDDVFDQLFREFFRRKDQLRITVADDQLTVRGETRQESEQKRRHYYRQEIRQGAFQRSIALPVEVDAAKARAELKNGVLQITLPKSKQPKAKEIEVSVG
jgi:HSP20 family protein